MQLRARSRIIEDTTNPSGHFDQAPSRPMSPKRPQAVTPEIASGDDHPPKRPCHQGIRSRWTPGAHARDD